MINLFTSYYKAKDEERQQELKSCLEQNIYNKLIDRIIVLAESTINTWGIPLSAKTREVQLTKRPTFQDFFNLTKEYPNDINIIANSDIFFDESIKLVNNIGDNDCYALTRWEYNNGDIKDFNRIHGAPPEWSQDAWVFKGSFRLNNCETVWAIDQESRTSSSIPFTMGVPGCENHLAYLLSNAGYNVTNPSKSIRAIHVHKETARDYGHKYRVTGVQSNKMTWGKLRKVNQV